MVFRFQINRLLFSSIVSFPVQSCSFRTIFCYLYHILIIFYRVMFAFSSHFHQIFINFSNFYCLLHVRVPAITRLDTSCPTEKPFKTLRKLHNLHVSLIKRPADGIAHRQGTAQLQQQFDSNQLLNQLNIHTFSMSFDHIYYVTTILTSSISAISTIFLLKANVFAF